MGSIMRKNYGKTFGVFEFWKGKVSKSGCIAQVEKGNDLFLITVELQIATQKGVRYFLSKTITFFCGWNQCNMGHKKMKMIWRRGAQPHRANSHIHSVPFSSTVAKHEVFLY